MPATVVSADDSKKIRIEGVSALCEGLFDAMLIEPWSVFLIGALNVFEVSIAQHGHQRLHPLGLSMLCAMGGVP
jgi:hypothetical protein